VYYQIDPVQWRSDERDKKHLTNIQSYYTRYTLFIEPVIICDSYYLDKQDSAVKDILNKIGKVTQENQSFDQYFKTYNEIDQQIRQWFGDRSDACDRFIAQALTSLQTITEQCQFEIQTKELHLPVYELSEQEREVYQDSDQLFWDLIDKGLQSKVIDKGLDPDVYYARVEEEVEVLKQGNIIDYFLILYDIISWCTQQGILTGIGRGSGGGSLVAYLLGLIKVDPLEYDLLFERFLNKGRILKSLPDLDTDVAGNRRSEVKRYIEQRYGVDNVCSIGTYGTFKIKAGFNDLCRVNGQPPQTIRYHASMLTEDQNNWDYESLFKQVVARDQLKSFVNDNYNTLNILPLILGQCKTTSVHAAGVVITPKTYKGQVMTIFDWMPIKKMDGILISEWEGPELESAGFLKEDILGIRQLDKISAIFKLIEGNGKTVPDLNNIDVNDDNVYQLFKQGFNQDLFHFGSLGLTQYSQQVKPDNIEELIAMIAAYRPGAMEFNAHKDFVSIKFGRKEPEYDFGLREVTENTGSLYLYQEQVMKACQVLGGLTLVEADDVRKAMGKKQLDVLQAWKGRFIESALSKGCPEYEAHKIWSKLEAFAGYGFNRSHACVYALTGYFCQWLKYHYPIEFWTVALQYADDEEIPERINELSRLGNLKIMPPDINRSQLIFTSDMTTDTIYWSINKISKVGEVAVKAIIDERDRGGKFFSLREFCSRVEKRKVNKACVVNLILSGAFDDIEAITDIRDRKTVLIKYLTSIKEQIPNEYLTSDSNKEWFWYLQQKNVSGSGIFDFTKLFPLIGIPQIEISYCPPERVLLEDNENCRATVIGVLNEVLEKSSKKGQFGHLIMDHNNAPVEVTIWNESWIPNKQTLLDSVNKIIVVSGKIVFDKWRNKNVIHSQQDTVIEII